MELTIKYGTEGLDWGEILRILDNKKEIIKSEKTIRACDKVRAAFSNSYVVASAWVDNEMVGFCRALSDGVRQSVIYDLNVVESYRNRGIGKRLMNEIVALLPTGPIILYSVPGKESYYQSIGFKKLLTGMAMFPDVDKRAVLGFISNDG